MSALVLSAPHFHSEAAAYRFVEARVWPRGPICPHCGGTERNHALSGKSTRIGTYKCYDCRKPFTVKVGTIFESSHIPLRLWLQAIFLLASSKKGISANQLHRTLGCTLKSAWFLGHRIREAMRSADLTPFAQGGGSVEVDETFIGTDKVLSLIDRKSGAARSMVIDDLKSKTSVPILRQNIAKEARILADGAAYSRPLAFAEHRFVNHSAGKYVSLKDATVHTTIGSKVSSRFSSGMRGVYPHCAKKTSATVSGRVRLPLH